MLKNQINMKLLLVILSIFASGFSGVYSQIQVIHSNKIQENSTRDGVFYTLPRTVLEIEFVIVKTTSLKGPLSEFAAKYLAIYSGIDSDKIEYQISGIQIKELSEPDPDQVYFIQFPDRISKENRNLMINTLTNGTLSGINLLDKEPVKPSPAFIEIDSLITRNINDPQRNNFIQIITDGIKPREDIAREYVNQIKQIRENKVKLLSGFQEIGYTKDAIQFMIHELDALENQYLDLFRGKRISELDVMKYKYIPEPFKEGEEVPLLKFSENTGCMELRNPNQGDNVFIEVVRNGFTFATSKIKTSNLDGTDVTSGLYYRMPEVAEVRMYLNGMEILNKTTLINQFGTIRLIPPGKFKATLDPRSGALQNLIIE